MREGEAHGAESLALQHQAFVLWASSPGQRLKVLEITEVPRSSTCPSSRFCGEGAMRMWPNTISRRQTLYSEAEFLRVCARAHGGPLPIMPAPPAIFVTRSQPQPKGFRQQPLRPYGSLSYLNFLNLNHPPYALVWRGCPPYRSMTPIAVPVDTPRNAPMRATGAHHTSRARCRRSS